MQTKLVDERWYEPLKSMEEAQVRIQVLLRRLEEAEKIINKPDYELVKRLQAVKVAPESEDELQTLIADIKSMPITARGVRKPGLWVLPYKGETPVHREARLLTHDLDKKAVLQKHCKKGTEKKSEVKHRTQFPDELIDEKRTNAAWRFKPTKIEIIKR